jgi:hypothetical protein
MPSEDRAIGNFASVLEAMLPHLDVSHGHGKKGFGTNALNVRGKMFAMLAANREFVVKLPASRVRELIQSGKGLPFCMARRQMKEWIVIPPECSAHWSTLAHEAYMFVRGPSPLAPSP